MHIKVITQRLSTFRAHVRVKQHVIATKLQAANIMQARMLLQHLYGAGNVVALTVA